MNQHLKLIMLGGFAGCGKTTIANRYVSETPLALSIEGDEVITKLGQWRENIQEAVACKQSLTTALVADHLKRGHNVILPFLLGDAQEAAYYENLTRESGADFLEITLSVEKPDAVQRLLKRGTWGEEGLPPLTQEDIPKIERIYDSMVEAVKLRPNMIHIESEEDDIEGTYRNFLAAVTKA